MNENIGSKEQKIRMGIGSAAAAVAIFAPLRYKWKTLLAVAAFTGLFTGTTGFSPMRKALGVRR